MLKPEWFVHGLMIVNSMAGSSLLCKQFVFVLFLSLSEVAEQG